MFLDYICDARYGWIAECEQRVGARPVQVCHEWNTAVHVADYEGRPERRPLTRAELQAFFDAAGDRVESAAVVWAEGLAGGVPGRDLVQDGLRVGAAAAGGGHAGCLRLHCEPCRSGAGRVRGLPGAVRQGDAGQSAQRRMVATVMPWAARALEQYLAEVRPQYGCGAHPAVWLTERAARISARQVDDRFAQFRALAGLPSELSVHCLRHSYVSHLIEDGVDPLFVQQQVGHAWASTTATYTTVGADARNRMLRSALSRAYDADGGGDGRR